MNIGRNVDKKGSLCLECGILDQQKSQQRTDKPGIGLRVEELYMKDHLPKETIPSCTVAAQKYETGGPEKRPS